MMKLTRDVCGLSLFYTQLQSWELDYADQICPEG